MKKYLLLAIAALAFGAPNMADARSSYHHTYSYHPHRYGPIGGRHYTNVNGDSVHSPMQAASRPAGATAHCGDGTWSFSQHHRGTCSHHGGVSSW